LFLLDDVSNDILRTVTDRIFSFHPTSPTGAAWMILDDLPVNFVLFPSSFFPINFFPLCFFHRPTKYRKEKNTPVGHVGVSQSRKIMAVSIRRIGVFAFFFPLSATCIPALPGEILILCIFGFIHNHGVIRTCISSCFSLLSFLRHTGAGDFSLYYDKKRFIMGPRVERQKNLAFVLDQVSLFSGFFLFSPYGFHHFLRRS
jgi:hypothetical protein